MNAQQFLSIYLQDSFTESLAGLVNDLKNKESIQIKNLSGSLDAILCACVHERSNRSILIIAEGKEEAAYLQNDLQNLVNDKEVFLYPASFKRPYQVEETENANILHRAEILNRLNHKMSGNEVIITYPQALCEKVINKKSLTKNTISIHKGEEVDMEFIAELLISYDFEKEDFDFFEIATFIQENKHFY